jgi:hypothetical protein
MTDGRACWDCGGTLFRLADDADAGLVAECDDCGGRIDPSLLYAPGDATAREHYAVSMEADA